MTLPNLKLVAILAVTILSVFKTFGFAAGFDGIYANTTAYIFAPELTFDSTKIPALIYIAADSNEPFMKIAVDHEVKTLKDTCVSKLSSWVVFIGSKLHRQLSNDLDLTYQYCDGGAYSENVPLTKDTSERIRAEYRRTKPLFPALNPIAVPEIYALIIRETVTSIFDPNKYYFFIHTKAHGSKGFPIVSLKPETVDSKMTTQRSLLKQGGFDLSILDSTSNDLGSGYLQSLFEVIQNQNKDHLGPRRSSELSSENDHLAESEKTFSQSAFENIFNQLNQDKIKISFLLLEACSTPQLSEPENQDPRWFKNEIPVSSYYMAKGYLGYHNIDWDKVYNSTSWITLTSREMYQSIVRHLPFIENRILKNPGETENLNVEDGKDNPREDHQEIPNQNITNPIQHVFAGPDYTCVIKAKSKYLACWGSNEHGVLGDHLLGENTKTYFRPPKLIDKPTQYSMVSSSTNYACGVTTEGTLKCWGNASHEQLGQLLKQQTEVSSHIPNLVSIEDQFQMVSTASNKACGINKKGILICWGRNWKNHLDSQPEAPDFFDSKVVYSQVAVSTNFACGITKTSQLRCWSSWASDLLKAPDPIEFQSISKTRFTEIKSGNNHICALSRDKHLYCLGANSFGQLAANDIYKDSIITPTLVAKGDQFLAVYLGPETTCAIPITNQRVVKCWGKNADRFSSLPRQFLNSPNDTIRELAIGTEHICALTTLSFYCWGDNSKGQLGYEPSNIDLNRIDHIVSRPINVKDNVEYISVKVGLTHTCGITQGNKLKCWGSNSKGKLGIGNIAKDLDPTNFTPTFVDPKHKYKSLALGSSHSCAVNLEGHLRCWGNNQYGQLGLPSSSADEVLPSPIPVDPEVKFLKVVAADDISCGLTQLHKIKCWGKFDSVLAEDQVNNSYSPDPTLIEGNDQFSDLAVAPSFACAITHEKKIKCWGEVNHFKYNSHYPIYSHYARSPITIDPETNYAAISMSSSHSCGLTEDHRIKCWGTKNEKIMKPTNSELKNHSWWQKPSYFDTNLRFETVITGFQKSCGKIAGQNKLFCWGSNLGLLGEQPNEGNSKQLENTTISGTQIALGYKHSCLIKNSGSLYCWGSNDYGQLGIGETNSPLDRTK